MIRWVLIVVVVIANVLGALVFLAPGTIGHAEFTGWFFESNAWLIVGIGAAGIAAAAGLAVKMRSSRLVERNARGNGVSPAP